MNRMSDSYPLAILTGSNGYTMAASGNGEGVAIPAKLPRPVRVTVWSKRAVMGAMEPIRTATYLVP